MGVIRFLLALSVVVFHSRPFIGDLTFVPGFTAVQLFFIISGFYMSLILNEKYTRSRDFYRARLLKIFPVYWAALILGIVILGIFLPYSRFRENQLDFSAFAYLSFTNFFILGSEMVAILRPATDGSLHFIRFSEPQALSMWSFLVIGPVWSLSVELYFYFLAPYLVRLNRLYLPKLIGILVADACLRGWLRSSGVPEVPWTYNLFPTALAYFMLGSVCYAVYRGLAKDHPGAKIIGWVGLLSLGTAFVFFNKLPIHFTVRLIGLTFSSVTALFIGVIVFTPFIFEMSKRSKLDRVIGELSYPLYAVHWVFTNYYHDSPNMHPIVPTLGVALLLHWAITRPMEKIRHRSSKRADIANPENVIPWPEANPKQVAEA